MKLTWLHYTYIPAIYPHKNLFQRVPVSKFHKDISKIVSLHIKGGFCGKTKILEELEWNLAHELRSFNYSYIYESSVLKTIFGGYIYMGARWYNELSMSYFKQAFPCTKIIVCSKFHQDLEKFRPYLYFSILWC